MGKCQLILHKVDLTELPFAQYLRTICAVFAHHLRSICAPFRIAQDLCSISPPCLLSFSSPCPMFFIIFAILALISNAYKIDLDLNTYNANELGILAQGRLPADGTWSITVNSPGTTDTQWRNAIAGVNPNADSYSEDNPGGFAECKRVRTVSPGGRLLAAFHYHETGGEPNTMLTWSQIDQAYNQCQCGIIILTRAYWPGHPWRTNVEKVLTHPKLYGVAIEFAPQDVGARWEEDFVNEILNYGKSPFFLLPFDTITPTEAVMTNFLNVLRAKGARIGDPRVHIVIARYGVPVVPILGGSNSILSALNAAKNYRNAMLANDSSIYTPVNVDAKPEVHFQSRLEMTEKVVQIVNADNVVV
jgi:hypothetical protein